MWYIAKALQLIGLVQVLGGLYIGFSQNDQAAELKIAVIGIAIFAIGRIIEMKSSNK